MKTNKLYVIAPAAAILLAAQACASTTGYSLGLNFGADEYPDSGAGRLEAAEIAGVEAVKQAHWNNLDGAAGSASNVTADDRGNAASTTVTVDWTCPNTWSTTGRGEENNGFPAGSPDHALMTGYLDTGDPTTTQVVIAGLPTQLTSGYDVYVYLTGGTGGNRGGGYRITDLVGETLRDYLVGDAPVMPAAYVRDIGLTHDDKGNYLVFRGLTAANIIVEATTEQPHGMVRAPLNAIQLVAAAKDVQAPSVPANLVATEVAGAYVELKWDASTDNSDAFWYELERDGVVIATQVGTTYRDAGVRPQTPYVYRVRAIDDSLNPSAFSAPLALTTLGEIEVIGTVKDEIYTGLDTAVGQVSALLEDPNFPDNPGAILYRTEPEGPVGYGDGYGSRLSGWFTPSRSGDYIFYLTADDNAELYLSTDATPANKKRIAAETAWSNTREWVASSGGSDNSAKRSDQYTATEWSGNTISLTAGTKYYFETLQKEGGGGDNVGFTYSIVGEPEPANGDAPVIGTEYSGMVDPTGASVTITQQPVSTTAPEGTPVTSPLRGSGKGEVCIIRHGI